MSTKLVQRTLINITDGSTRSFGDDGSDVDGVTGKFKAHRVRRTIIVAALEQKIAKGPHAGTPVFWATEKFAPLFQGDPLPGLARVLDPAAKKVMAELVAERERFLSTSRVQADNEAALALNQVKRANTAAAQGAGDSKSEG